MSTTVGSFGGGGVDDILQQKKALRRDIRSKMRALSREQISVQSIQVWERLFALPAYRKAQSVGLFLSMPAGEIDTDPALRNAVENGKQIYVPEVGKNFERMDMELRKVVVDHNDTAAGSSSEQQLFHHSWPRNKWNIPEPPPEMPLHPAAPGDIDLVVVPGLAFDRKGGRLGQGKGYYDRFLERMSKGDGIEPPLLVAVGLDCQLVDFVPVAEYDRTMNIVLLPNETIQVVPP